jgi:ABC-type multidrug transport system fused ATPase/permease subunit
MASPLGNDAGGQGDRGLHLVREDAGSAYRLLSPRQRIAFVGLTLARIVVGVCDLLLAAAMYFLFLLLQGGSPAHHSRWMPHTTLSAALITAALVVLRSLVELLSTRTLVKYIQGLYTGLLLRLTRGYSEMRWGKFVELNRSELLNHTVHTAKEAADFYLRGIELVASSVTVAMMSVALFDENRVAAGALAIAVALFYAVHRFFIRNRLQTAAAERERSTRSLQRTLADLLSSGKEIRTYRNYPFFHERVRDKAESMGISQVRITLMPQIARILTDQGVVLLFLGVVTAVELRHGDVRQLLSVLVFYFVLSRRLLPLISMVSFLAGQMEGSYENVRAVSDELSRCTINHETVLPTHLPDRDVVMELEHVSFSFGEGTPFLRDVSFQQRKGERILLRGPSGCGKSSLLNMVAGVIQPTMGVVRVDRVTVAYVPQDIVLLDDTIRNNLLFGLPKKDDAKLMRALSVAKLDEFVDEHPLGLDARVGDNGILFSGGQRQRLGLARAILRGASLLLLDEATSALDEKNEAEVLENLGACGMAVLLVTHRVHNRIGFADRVLRLEDGRLIEERGSSAPAFDTPYVDVVAHY